MLHLIESNIEKLNGLSRFIASSGIGLRTFNSPLLYLEYAKSAEFEPPIALITSYHMPMMNGSELAAEIKKLHPKQKVVLTSDFAENEIAKQVGESICSYLHRPNFYAKLATLLKVLETCGRGSERFNFGMFSSVCRIESNRSCPHHDCN